MTVEGVEDGAPGQMAGDADRALRDGILLACVQLARRAGWFELVDDLAQSDWREAVGGLHQGIGCTALAFRLPAWMDIGGLGRALGSVLATLDEMGRHQGEIRVAELLFSGGRGYKAGHLFAEAVRTPGAGVPMTLGCLACSDDWSLCFDGYRFAPDTLAWMLGGLRLYMPAAVRRKFAEAGWGESEFFDGIATDMLASVREWSEADLVTFTQARACVDACVDACNANSGRGRVAERRAMALFHKLSPVIDREVETILATKRVGRRLAGGTCRDRPPRKRV